ncbi:MAG TPA: SDR family NAD(P)-dependent oxidoreductase [Methylomirabilota bacterium]|nr:SDR family NAD(P)-dependent oxidoreductase [Methylomirabilota bacterium]
MNISGHSAIVTGGGSGLGRATARALAARGARVGVIDRNADAAMRVAAEIGGLGLVGDVADEAAMASALSAAREAHGPCRVLVNCAGIGAARRVVGREGPMPLADFERVIRVNLVGAFNMIRLAGAEMSVAEPLECGGRGVIVTTASAAAFEGQIGQSAYSASKGGIASLTLPVAREFAAFGIRVMCIAPGLFETPLLEQLPEETRRALAAAVPYPKRLGAPEEFAALALHIVENDFLNGETIRIDGALRLPPK